MLLASLAFAETAGTLPAGSSVLYAGPAVVTYQRLMLGEGWFFSENSLDRALQLRLDLFGAVGLGERVQLAAYVPVIHSRVLESDDQPCSPGSAFCAPISGVGSAGVQARYRALSEPLGLSVGLGVSSAAWLSGVRGRYTMVGEATTDIAPAVYAERKLGPVAVVLFGSYNLRLVTYEQDELQAAFAARGVAPEKYPHDDIRAGAEAKLGVGIASVQLGAYTLQRLGGTEFRAYGDTDDIWATVDYDAFSVGTKVSIGLPANMGLHVSVGRMLWVRNGPPDTIDASIGVHKYFPAG